MKNRYYLYFHYCNNVPFYVGVGTKLNRSNPYARAHHTHKRNNYWNNVFKNCKNFRVEIIEECDDRRHIEEKEKFWIAKFGRRINIERGLLTNISEGGEVAFGRSRKVAEYDLNGKFLRIWATVFEAAKGREISMGVIKAAARRERQRKAGKSQWFIIKQDGKYPESLPSYFDHRPIKVLQLSMTDEVIKEYNSMKQASDDTGIDSTNISRCANGNRETAGGYKWSLSRLD